MSDMSDSMRDDPMEEYAPFEPENTPMLDFDLETTSETEVGISPPATYKLFGVGDLVISAPDERWGTIEVVNGNWRGIRFGNDEAAVRRLEQLQRTGNAIPVAVGECLAKQAALNAQKLTAKMVELKAFIEQPGTYEAIQAADATFIADFEKLLENWREFMSRLAGTDIPNWNAIGKLAQGFWLVFDHKEIFSAVQGYRVKFAALVNRYSKALGGEPLTAEVGSTGGTQAGHDAQQLTNDMAALRKVMEVPENSLTIQAADAAFIPAFDEMVKSWNKFIEHAAGKDIGWYNLPGKASRSFWAVFEGTSLYNTTQDYRTKFNQFSDKLDGILGRQSLPYKPEPPKARKTDKTPTEWMGELGEKLVTGVLIVGGVVGGGWLLLRLAGK